MLSKCGHRRSSNRQKSGPGVTCCFADDPSQGKTRTKKVVGARKGVQLPGKGLHKKLCPRYRALLGPRKLLPLTLESFKLRTRAPGIVTVNVAWLGLPNWCSDAPKPERHATGSKPHAQHRSLHIHAHNIAHSVAHTIHYELSTAHCRKKSFLFFLSKRGVE